MSPEPQQLDAFCNHCVRKRQKKGYPAQAPLPRRAQRRETRHPFFYRTPDKPGSPSNILGAFLRGAPPITSSMRRSRVQTSMRGQPHGNTFLPMSRSDLNDPEHGDLLEQLGHACNKVSAYRQEDCYPTGPQQLDRMSIAEQSK